jgi:mono/diheme cytochrome c family protein
MRWMRFVPGVLFAMSLVSIAALGSCTPAAKQEPAAPAAMTQEQKVERGQYLVSVLGCNDCHTPGSLYGAPDTTRMLAGSELGWRGPWGISFPSNLTPDSTGIASWSEDDIVTAIRTGHRPDHSPLLPPMPWPSYAHLTDDDAHSVAAYLKTIPAVHHVNVTAVPPGKRYKGAYLDFPPPPAWDAPKAPPPGAQGAAK